jgi:hypothetical protein
MTKQVEIKITYMALPMVNESMIQLILPAAKQQRNLLENLPSEERDRYRLDDHRVLKETSKKFENLLLGISSAQDM